MIKRPMRRKDREVTDMGKIENVIDKARYCHLSLFDGEWPYIFPISFGYEPGHLYFHSAREGKKIDIVKVNNKASFSLEIDTIAIPKPKGRSGLIQTYKSIIGFGEITIIDDNDEEGKIHALKVLAAHYCRQGVDIPRPRGILDRVAVWDLKILHITGKEKGPFIER